MHRVRPVVWAMRGWFRKQSQAKNSLDTHWAPAVTGLEEYRPVWMRRYICLGVFFSQMLLRKGWFAWAYESGANERKQQDCSRGACCKGFLFELGIQWHSLQGNYSDARLFGNFPVVCGQWGSFSPIWTRGLYLVRNICPRSQGVIFD